MSAYVIDKTLMDHVIYGYSKIGIAFAGSVDAAGRQFYKQNLDAVLQRYPKDTKETAPGPGDLSNIHENYRFQHHSNNNLLNSYSAIQCLIYQCSEGDVPTREGYRDLERLRAWIADRIIRDTVGVPDSWKLEDAA